VQNLWQKRQQRQGDDRVLAIGRAQNPRMGCAHPDVQLT
jgi:hypothetical protein